MPTRRSYVDPCGIARALDLVGERWALLVVRELVLGPKRFTDLRAGLLNLSPDVLAQRLRELERSGVVRRRKLPPPAGSHVYDLTAWGRELEPVVLALGRWGSRAEFPPGQSPLGVDALMLALLTLFDAPAAAGFSARVELRFGEQFFHARVANGHLEVARAAAEIPDTVIETDPATLAQVLWHGRPLAEAQRSGAIAIDGDRAAFERFVGLFPTPQPASGATLDSP
jgi:DNA-binding HxlR family transcriptional regulator